LTLVSSKYFNNPCPWCTVLRHELGIICFNFESLQ
jgi:hypothetical protein